MINLNDQKYFYEKTKSKREILYRTTRWCNRFGSFSKWQKFLTDLIDLIESHLSNPEMNIDYICSQIGMSRTKLYNKIKSLTGQSIGDFIRTIRLKKAVQLMSHENMSIAKVMCNIEIQTQSYFPKLLKQSLAKRQCSFWRIWSGERFKKCNLVNECIKNVWQMLVGLLK